MSILSKLANLEKTDPTAKSVQMTDEQFKSCKEALKRDNRGYNVHPNRFDVDTPYRVAINYNNKWENFGNFKSADVAAAIGAIVSTGYFGSKAKSGEYNLEAVESNQEYKTWVEASSTREIIARSSGDQDTVHTYAAQTDDIPF